MSPELSAEEIDTLLFYLGHVKPVSGSMWGPGYTRDWILLTPCNCCGLTIKGGAITGIRGFKASAAFDTVPEPTMEECLLIPDKELNYLIEWNNL